MPETAQLSAWAVALLCGLATYLWRGIGVALSGLVRPQSELFTWVGCVAYAMVAGLVARILLMPGGMLAQTLLADRLLAAAAAAAVFFFGGRNLFVGVATGGVALVIINLLRTV
ncbi:MAG TPA: AzlD domain-containing protein [Pelomicrobium sp.]|nr:AzlD domain-containing protein [Pelomicrobium sp.]